MAPTATKRHRHRTTHDDKPLLLRWWLVGSGRLQAWRHSIVGSVLILIAACVMAAGLRGPYQFPVSAPKGLPGLMAACCYGIVGAFSAISGGILLRAKYRGRLPAVISIALLLAGAGLSAGQALFAWMEKKLVPFAEGPWPLFLMVMAMYIAASILFVRRMWKILKADRRTHRRPTHHRRRRTPPPAEVSEVAADMNTQFAALSPVPDDLE